MLDEEGGTDGNQCALNKETDSAERIEADEADDDDNHDHDVDED